MEVRQFQERAWLLIKIPINRSRLYVVWQCALCHVALCTISYVTVSCGTVACGSVHYVICHCVVWQCALCHVLVCHCVMWQYVTMSCGSKLYGSMSLSHVAVCHMAVGTMSCSSMSLCHVFMWQYVTVSCGNVALCPYAVWHCCTMTVGDLLGHHILPVCGAGCSAVKYNILLCYDMHTSSYRCRDCCDTVLMFIPILISFLL